jgi:hypothetical protein
MDDIVLRGMAKWPNVPAVYGWLSLNRRGQWLIKGEPVTNPTISAFIGRNYERDADGAWFFQNGPQRVFVGLEYAPFVYRLVPNGEASSLALEAQTGARARVVTGAWLDEHGVLLVETDCGVGVVHDGDLDTAALAFVDARGEPVEAAALEAALERLERGEAASLWFKHAASVVKVEPVNSLDAPGRFGFVPAPRTPEGHPECS